MEKAGQERARMESGFKQGVNILSLGPNSSPADIMLNARLSQMSDEERIKEVLASMLFFIGKPNGEKNLMWLKNLLRRVFELKQYDPVRNYHQEFMLCLKAIYLCLIFGEAESKFSFSEFKEEFWKDLMREWFVQFYAREPDQKILTFFLNRYALAPKEEKKIMSGIFRQRLTDARVEEVEGWVKWIFASDKPEAWRFQPEISRHLAVARASAGGRNLLLQDIRGGELLKALDKTEGFNANLLPTLKDACDRIIDFDAATSIFVGRMKSILEECFVSIERISYKIGLPDSLTPRLEIHIYCDPGKDKRANWDYSSVVELVQGLLTKKGSIFLPRTMEGYFGENGGVFLSNCFVNMALRVYDLDGNEKERRDWFIKYK